MYIVKMDHDAKMIWSNNSFTNEIMPSIATAGANGDCTNFKEFITADYIEDFNKFLNAMRDGNETGDIQLCHTTTANQAIYAIWSSADDIHKNSDTFSIVGFDVTEKLDAYEKLLENEKKLRILSDALNDAIFEFNMATGKGLLCAKGNSFLGFDQDILVDDDFFAEHFTPEQRGTLRQGFQDLLEKKITLYENDFKVRMSQGNYRWVIIRGALFKEKRKPSYKIIGSVFDFDSKKLANLRRENMLYQDFLTGLLNRSGFSVAVNDILCKTEDEDVNYTLLYIDIDNFRIINNSYGYTLGDRVLEEIGRILVDFSKGKGIASRLSGDEFALFFYIPYSEEEIKDNIKSLMQLVQASFQKMDIIITDSISVGVAKREDCKDFEDMLNKSKLAMDIAKDAGRNTFVIYNESIRVSFDEELRMEKHLRYAVENEELHMHFQPTINITNGKVYGFEALCRWHSNIYGDVPPSIFIPIAEEKHFISKVCNQVIKRSCKFVQELYKLGFHDIVVSVNISNDKLMQSDFVQSIITIIEAEGVNPKNIQLEITESVLIDDVKNAVSKLNEIREYGVSLALDDFGTGFSSLSYLRALPVDVLKIDKSFIDNIAVDEASAQLLNKVIELAGVLNINVIVEGVETLAQLDVLKKFHAQRVQGFYFSKPLEERSALDFIVQNRLFLED